MFGDIKRQSLLLSPAGRFDSNTSPKVNPLYGTSEQARKYREAHQSLEMIKSVKMSHMILLAFLA